MLENEKEIKEDNNKRIEKRGLLLGEEEGSNNDTTENTNFEGEEVENNNLPWHKKILKGMVTGVGFLSDAYDLYVINHSFIINNSLLSSFQFFLQNNMQDITLIIQFHYFTN